MSKSIRIIALLGFAVGLAACAQPEPEEFVVVEPEPISMEPVVVGGKYK